MLEWLKRITLLSRESIYHNLLAYFIMFALIPALVVNFLYFSLSSRSINEATTKIGSEIITKISSELNYFLESVVLLGDVVVDNQRVQEVLRMNFGDDLALRYSTDLSTDTELYFASFLQPKIAGLSVLGENGGEYKSYDRAFLNQTHSEQEWYKRIVESEQYVWFPPHRGQYANVSDGERESFISYGKAITDKATGMATGVLLIDINERAIRQIISTELGESGYLLILDEGNNVIMSSIGMEGYLTHLTENIAQKKEGTFTTKMIVEYKGNSDMQSVVATYQEIPITGWKVMGIIPIKQLDRWGNILLILMTALTVMIVLMAIYMAVRTSNRFAKPIQNLRLAMSHVEEGNLDITIDLDSHYQEINQLARSFNIMVSKVKGLMTDIYEDQRKLRKAELKALQSQINPHFLYNTFDSILWLNRSDRKEDVETMVESLTDFFRLSLSRGKEIIPLEEEVKHLESYLMIQHIRYGDKFDYSIDVDKEALTKMVPKLVLQPLVENAIYHGIKLKKENCTISITIRSEKETVITIKDTGVGMSEDKVNQLNRAMKGETVPGLELYGIRNIRDRLAIFFGETANINYKSIVGEGTTVTIVFPIISIDTDI